MTVVTPMLLRGLVETGRPIPWPTRVLKALSDLIVGYGWLMAVMTAVFVVLIGTLLRTRRGRRWWHGVILKIPVVGFLAQRQAISRMAMVMSTLMRSGIVYLEAAAIAGRSSGNLVLEEALTQSSEHVRSGAEIGQALQRTGVFPPVVVHIFSIGTASGHLEEMLERLATTYDRQVASRRTWRRLNAGNGARLPDA